MEIKNERVFAYNLAKVINHTDLENVSGGSAQTTTRATSVLTGSAERGFDMDCDVSLDW